MKYKLKEKYVDYENEIELPPNIHIVSLTKSPANPGYWLKYLEPIHQAITKTKKKVKKNEDSN